MIVAILPSAKAKDVYGLFFDAAFVEGALGKASFLNENPQSKYKLGNLGGLVLHCAPNAMIALSAKAAAGRDAVVVLNVYDLKPGARIEAAAVNLPEGEIGAKLEKSLGELLDAFVSRFGGGREKAGGEAKKAKAKVPVAKPTKAKASSPKA